MPAWPALPSAIFFLLGCLLLVSYRPLADRRATPPRHRRKGERNNVPAGLAGRLANNLHAVAIITKYRADERGRFSGARPSKQAATTRKPEPLASTDVGWSAASFADNASTSIAPAGPT